MGQYKKDMIASFSFLILGVLALISVPLTAQDPGVSVMDPCVFPCSIGVRVVILSLALMFTTIVKHHKVGGADNTGTFASEKERKRALRDESRALLLVTVILAYTALLQILGYFISTLLVAIIIPFIFRVKKTWAYPVVYATVVVIWVGFTFLFSVRLSRGEERNTIGPVLSSLFTLKNLLWISIGLAGGIMVGALSGLTGTMTMALPPPPTYGLASAPGVMLLLSVYCGSIYGGSIIIILINTPSTLASVATSPDGYPMAQKGHGLRVLHDALPASIIGGLLNCEVLLFAALPTASFAPKFGPAEYFTLVLFGLMITAGVSGKPQIKGLLMGFVGLLISCIGIDPMDGVSCFTFGINRVEGGIDTIPMLIDLLAIMETMAKARNMNKVTRTAVKVEKGKTRFRDILKHKVVLLKSSILGVLIGAAPGTGAAIFSFLAYSKAKRTSKHPREYGHGPGEAVVVFESVDNVVMDTIPIPLLTLGISGDANTVVFLGALTMQGITVGPQLFTQHGEWIYIVILGLIAVNIFTYLQGWVFVRDFINTTRVPISILVLILVMLCVIGAYATDHSVFSAIFMVGASTPGYLMTKPDMPMISMVTDPVLGKLCKSNLRRAPTISKGSWTMLFVSPISLLFTLLSLFTLFFPCIKKKLAARRVTA